MVGEQDRQGLAPAPYWSKAAAAPLLVPSSSHDSWAAGWRCSSPAWTARTTRYRRYCGCCWRRGLGQPSSSACWSSTPMGEPPAALRRATRGAALLQRVRVLQAAGSPRRSPRCTCPSYIFLLAPPLHSRLQSAARSLFFLSFRLHTEGRRLKQVATGMPS